MSRSHANYLSHPQCVPLFWPIKPNVNVCSTDSYGDIQPVVDQERAYATIIMVIGATVFGYIVGSVSALASNPKGSQARETIQILAVSNYLDEKKVQQKLKQVS